MQNPEKPSTIKTLEKPELLMPAGSFQKLEYAFNYGADAVYVGVPYFSLRARENDFSMENLYKAREMADKMGKKIYMTINIFGRNRKLKPFTNQLDELLKSKPDALIMSDPGMMSLVRERSDVPIHLSVQANCMNWSAVKFWHESLGVSRVILSRELNLNEIREIKQRVPEVELEAFVHGSLCIAYSGRCLMSSYFSYRDANNGVCDNSCREKFNIHEKVKETEFFVEDKRSPGEFYQIDEDDEGTYIMNSKDLRLIHHLKEITDAGVCSFKVEGRTKSLNYVSLVTRAYRQAIDDMYSGKEFDPKLLQELDRVANRGYTEGFMIPGAKPQEAQNYEHGGSKSKNFKFAGLHTEKFAEEIPAGYVPIEVRNRIELGQTLEVLSPDESTASFVVSDIINSKLEKVDVAHGGAGIYLFKSDIKPNEKSLYSLIVE